jgi:hypothetical protein
MSSLDIQLPRWSIYVLILISATAAQAGRIASTRSATGELPFYSANDRSRWCTLVSLVEQGTFQIDEVVQRTDPERKNRKPWNTIDMVRHRGEDGKQHYYSSKPPFLTTIYASVYWVFNKATNKTLTAEPFFVARSLLLIVNLLPLLGYWLLLIWLIERTTLDPWSRIFLVFASVWALYSSTFASTLNNHLPGTIAVLVSLVALIRITIDQSQHWVWPLLCGLSASFAIACELPALAWWAILVPLLYITTRKLKPAILYVAASIPVAAGILITTQLAHGDLRPPYMHREAGAVVTTAARNASDTTPEPSLPALKEALTSAGNKLSDKLEIRQARQAEPPTWELLDTEQQYCWAVQAGEGTWELRQWDDWYDYPNTYWVPEKKSGVDKGETSVPLYAFHTLIGHRGIFSLTPLWFFAIFGAVIAWNKQPQWRIIHLAAIIVSIVCIGFFIARPLDDRNYGGVCSGFRWVFWLAPLWMLFLPHGIEAVSRSLWGRRLALTALAISIFSATFPWNNPWTQPWTFQILEYFAWIKY